MKDCQDEFNRKIAIDRHSGFFVNANRRVALDCDESTKLFVRQLRDGLRQIVNSLALFAGKGKNRMPTERGQSAPQLRLKNHYQRDCKEDRKTSHDPTDHNQIEQLRNQRQR